MKFRHQLAAQYLNSGGVISIPTDTIQGLSCLADNDHAISRIIQLKQRSDNKGLILLSSSVDYFYPFVANAELVKKIKIEDKPTTYLLKASSDVSPLITGAFDTVAIRLTDNPLICDLSEATQSALVSTSANISNQKVAQSILELKKSFNNELDFIISPKNYNSAPSRIINLETGERLR